MSKLIRYHQGYVTARNKARIWIWLDDETEWEMPRRKFAKLFGRKQAGRGRIVEIWVRQRRNRRYVIWGRPYVRVWTQEEIDAAEREGERLWHALHEAFE